MTHTLLAIFKISAPLIFAMLGALLTEYTGALAIFMEGAISLACFFCAIFVVYTGSKILAFLISTLLLMMLVCLFSIFIEKYKANPFLVGLSINMFAEGICSFYVSNFSNSKTIVFSEFLSSSHIMSGMSLMPTFLAILITFSLFLFFKYTSYGIRLKYVGQYEEVLTFKGVACGVYKIVSWTMAAFFASCAGNILVFRLAAYTHGMSAGKGWIGILAVFLGLKKPMLCLIAVFIFSSAEYATNILQSKINFSPTLLLAFPYVFSFVLYVIYKIGKKKRII